MTERNDQNSEHVPVRRRDLRARGFFDQNAPGQQSEDAAQAQDAPAREPRNAEPTQQTRQPQSQAQRPEQVQAQPQPQPQPEPKPKPQPESQPQPSPAAPSPTPAEPATGMLPQPVAAHDERPGVFEEVPTTPRHKHRKRNQAIVFGIVLVLFVTGIFLFAPRVMDMFGLGKPTDFPGPGTETVTFSIKEGEASRSIANNLQQQGIVASSDAFLKTLDETANGRAIQPGDFEMRKEMSNAGAVEALLSEAARVTYIPLDAGLRVGESLQRIADGAHVDISELEALNKDPQQFGLPAQAKSLEGYLWPGEYRFDEGTSAKDIIQTLVDKTKEELTKLGVTDPAEQYRTLTFASIVQAEGNQTDYARIAGALTNRLKGDNPETGGRIESDATVIYGLDRRSLNVTAEEKADTSNPYNTFAMTGLPVGPIDTPGLDALKAAINPEQNDYYYWVTVNLDTGETLFARTYQEHLANVDKYQQWCAANAGRCE